MSNLYHRQRYVARRNTLICHLIQRQPEREAGSPCGEAPKIRARGSCLRPPPRAHPRSAPAGASSLRSRGQGSLSPDPRRLERAHARRRLSESSRPTMHRHYAIWNDDGAPPAAWRSSPPSTANRAAMRPLPSASPASSAAGPRPTIRRQALPSRVGEGSVKPSTVVR